MTIYVNNDDLDTNVEVIDLGQLSDIAWPGKVSAIDMIATGYTTRETIEKAVASIDKFYVSVARRAPTRCIDGRHDPKLDENHLGPQVPGGAPGAALAYRLGVDEDDLTRGTFLADAEAMISNFLRLGFAPGGHRDENSTEDGMVGCGAIDGLDKVIAAMINPELVTDHKRIVKLFLGTDFDRDTYLKVLGAAALVNGRSDEYFMNRQKVIDVLEERSEGSIATLQGQHQECIVIVNLVPNTTFSSNKFAAANDGVQAFGYDLWRSIQMAGKVLPRPDQAKDRQRFVIARVMTTIATLMVLTDGTQRLVLRTNTPVVD